ncbi:MAG: 1-acyl-sn-glycerol-3-phosphate acyltransferase [Bacilli bacterium]|nr:1-acyl-sn-glycerol-3-phosphate acyltransferase [Bacilli bacterium]
MWHILRTVLLSAPRIIASYFAWMLSYSRKNTKTPIERRYKKARKLILKVNHNLKLDVLVEGKENIPNETCCFYSNHMGAADPLLYFQAIDKPVTFVAKKEIEKLPFVGRVFRSIDGQFLDRGDLKQSLRVMMRVQDSLTKKEINWVVFPEGTRNKDNMGKLLPFHHGTFRAAMKAKVPLVPTVVFGSFRILHTKHNFKRYPTYIKFLKPIYPSEYEGMTTEEVARIVQSRVQAEVTFQARKIDHSRMVELHDKYYRFNRIY